jgi:hypothetical protein
MTSGLISTFLSTGGQTKDESAGAEGRRDGVLRCQEGVEGRLRPLRLWVQQQQAPQGAPRHVWGFLKHYVLAHRQDLAPRNCDDGSCVKSSAAPQVDGDADWLRRFRLPQEHGGRRAASATRLPIHCQHQDVPCLNRRWCGAQPHQSCGLQ